MRRVGRPLKYRDETTKTEIRKIQNRENQRKCRMRKKLKDELRLLSKSPLDFNDQYKNDLITFHKRYEYDYFFTGTVDMDKEERKVMGVENQQITKFNQEYETEFGYKTDKKIGIKSLRRYTERFLQHLSEKNLFEHCFVVFEMNKNYKYHIHILFKSNPEKINFNITTKKSWLLGQQNITEPVFDKEGVLKYMVKELKPTSTKITDQNKVDNWFIWGDFKKESEVVNDKKLFQIFEPI
jgi:hypothetical protein